MEKLHAIIIFLCVVLLASLCLLAYAVLHDPDAPSTPEATPTYTPPGGPWWLYEDTSGENGTLWENPDGVPNSTWMNNITGAKPTPPMPPAPWDNVTATAKPTPPLPPAPSMP